MSELTPTQKLVVALRSGEYQQATGALRIGDKFCCLGVACDLYLKEHPHAEAGWHSNARMGWYSGDQMSHEFDEGNGNSSRKDLTTGVQMWLGWLTDDGELSDRYPFKKEGQLNREATSLVGMNDGGYSFAEIADVIEAGKVKVVP